MGKEVELLAPAGSYDSFLAAITYGADAVYIGGAHFGARAFAQNFTTEEIRQAIDFAHLHGRKVFLTVNTLLKDKEMENDLYDYLLPLYEHGLDAVIVQDIGVIAYIRECFPDLPIHASTQMTVTSLSSVRYLERLGVSRIVTARELSLQELRKISENTDLEIESFVHGALCYSYSGQCLFSSLIGGRSGNRGQCAQPCRLPYQTDGKKQQYVMSLKDICTLKLIPELVEAGIYSFKVEGRMKSPVYVASVISMYRKYIDLYLKNGRENYHVEDKDIEHLMDVYNRGAFTNGYYEQRNGASMVSLKRPNHAGIPAIRVISDRKGVALRDLHKGDVMEIPGKNISFSMNQDVKEGKSVSLSPKHHISPKVTKQIFRTFNKEIADHYTEDLKKRKLKERINGKLILSVGNCARLFVDYREIHMELEGDVVQAAEKSPLSFDRIRGQMMKTGQTSFEWDSLDIICEGDVFLPMQSLNELRRQVLSDLESEVLNSYRRNRADKMNYPGKQPMDDDIDFVYSALVMKEEQLEPVIDSAGIREVYVDCNVVHNCFENHRLSELVSKIHLSGKRAYLALPHIIRRDTENQIKKGIPYIIECEFDGVLIRNIEGYELIKEAGYGGLILTDASLYMFNRMARNHWEDEGIFRGTIPVELNRKEIVDRGAMGDEVIGYGYLPMMHSAQCVNKTVYGCEKKSRTVSLTDRRKEKFTVENYCDFCYNIVYNSKPLYLLDQIPALKEMGLSGLRLQFTVEDQKETEKVLKHFEKIRSGFREDFMGDYTRGHWKRGVK